jgi:hypothetical protein
MDNMNYSPIALGIVILLALVAWIASAKYWFRGMKRYTSDSETELSSDSSPSDLEWSDDRLPPSNPVSYPLLDIIPQPINIPLRNPNPNSLKNINDQNIDERLLTRVGFRIE